MDQNPQQQGQVFRQQLDAYCQSGKFEDMPLSNEFLDGFGVDCYQVTAPGGLPSPNSSNPDLPGSGRQSPLLPCLSISAGGCGSRPSDGSSGADNDPLGSHLLQQTHESRTNVGSSTSNSRFNTDQSFLNASNGYSKTHMEQGEPSMTSSSSIKAGRHQTFTAPSEGSLCTSNNSFQSHAATVPSNYWFEQKVPLGRPMSTPLPVVPKALNNTSSASVPANPQHSPTSKPQQLVPYPSNLRHRNHSGLLQYSPFALTAADTNTASQVPETMSSNYEFTNRQEPNASPSQSDYVVVQRSSNRPPFRRITSAHNRSRGSPVLHNYQPFQESSLRTSVTSSSGQNPWENEQVQEPNYPDPQPIFQQQSNSSPYMGHHHVSRSQGSSIIGYSPEQYRMQPTDSQDVSVIGQRSMDFGFNRSSPMSVKCEVYSPDTDHAVSTPEFKSQMASPKPQKKRRVKQEARNNDDNEVAVDPFALQTADLTNLGPTDHTNVAALIDAMHNTDSVEDNRGMLKTWDKVRRAKALRIREVCVELLNLTKQAQQQKGTPLGEKRPLNQYASFEKRFDALCETLTYQKTVCKHLIEPPYSYSVVDDPQYAKDRVKNNRRVNHMKAEAIRLGREHLGEKGQGKGKPMLKTNKRGQAQIEDSQDDEEDSCDEPLSDGELDISTRVLGPESARSNPQTPKRTKRVHRSKYQLVNGVMTDTSLCQSTNSDHHQEQPGSVQASYLPQDHNLEDLFTQGLHQNAYVPTQQTQILSDHDRMLHGHTANQKMPTLNQHHGFQSGNEAGNIFYGDNSTGGSDSEGLGGTYH